MTDLLTELSARIAARRDAEASYTAQLLADPDRAVRKLGEEAVETMIAAMRAQKPELTAEAADLLYHLLVVLVAQGVPLEAVYAELSARAAQSGLAEKASRD